MTVSTLDSFNTPLKTATPNNVSIWHQRGNMMVTKKINPATTATVGLVGCLAMENNSSPSGGCPSTTVGAGDSSLSVALPLLSTEAGGFQVCGRRELTGTNGHIVYF